MFFRRGQRLWPAGNRMNTVVQKPFELFLALGELQARAPPLPPVLRSRPFARFPGDSP
jgi:hypothetical protein